MSDRARILVVDDDRNVRTVVSLRLRASGYDVVEAEDGNAALERVREGGIAAVVLDATMPGMDGFEVLEQLKKLENRPSVLLLTALPKTDSRILALDGDAADYIGKPFEPAKFLARIAAAVRKYEMIPGALNGALA